MTRETREHLYPLLPCFALVALATALASPRSLIAQGPPPPQTAAEDREAQAVTRNPLKEDLTVGVQLDAGRAATKSVSIAGDIWRNFHTGTIRFDAGEQYGSISAGGMRITSLNRQYGSFSWSHNLSKRYFFTQIDTIERDTIRLIDYRGSSLNALGIRLKREKVAFSFGGGFALVDERKNTPLDDGLRFQLGTFYSLVYNIDPHWQLTHWATYRNDVQVASDRMIDSAVSLTGMVTKALGIKISAAYNYEGVLAPGAALQGFSTRNYLTTTIGIGFHH